MIGSVRVWGLAFGVAMAASNAAGAEEAACTTVTADALQLPGLVLTGSKLQDAGDGLPRHCILSGTVDQRTGIDGHAYAIQFELRLPDNWNGRFLHQVNGGNDGVVVPALGDKPDGLVSGGLTPLSRGFAVLSSDSGHAGNDPTNKAHSLAAGAVFGLAISASETTPMRRAYPGSQPASDAHNSSSSVQRCRRAHFRSNRARRWSSPALT